MKSVRTEMLEIAYEEHGPTNGPPVILLHGFPYDGHAYDEVAPLLAKDRRDIARTLWGLWSPSWKFDDATFERSAKAFDNPDFVAVVVQSYRHRYGNAPGDPKLFEIEAALGKEPSIAAPTINIHGGD